MRQGQVGSGSHEQERQGAGELPTHQHTVRADAGGTGPELDIRRRGHERGLPEPHATDTQEGRCQDRGCGAEPV